MSKSATVRKLEHMVKRGEAVRHARKRRPPGSEPRFETIRLRNGVRIEKAAKRDLR